MQATVYEEIRYVLYLKLRKLRHFSSNTCLTNRAVMPTTTTKQTLENE